MFISKKSENTDSAKTIIGRDVIIDVNSFTGSGTIRIDGMLKGEINVDGSLIIGETGTVEGNMKANQILVAGKIIGDIKCEGEVHFTPSSHMTGNVYYATLVTDDGASINGFCQTISSISQKNEKVQATGNEIDDGIIKEN